MAAITVNRHASAHSFLSTATPLLMMAEAENHLIIGVAHGLAENPVDTKNRYLATVSHGTGVVGCAVYLPPSKLVLTRANREPVVALANDAYDAVPMIEGVTGPDRSSTDFALAWSKLSGVAARPGMRLRIHETRGMNEDALRDFSGLLRVATNADLDLLSAWAEMFVVESGVPEKVDSMALVADTIRRGRLYVWEENGRPVSMATLAAKTPSGVLINFVYTPRELRGKGYATACVAGLTRQQLSSGNVFCWLYTDRSSAAGGNIFKRLGYRPVSDMTEYYLRP
jgi:predicted GNAT family acetyltransferase